MKNKNYITILIFFISIAKCYSQVKTLNSGIIFQYYAFENSNPVYSLGYTKYKQNKLGRDYLSYYLTIGYTSQYNINYAIPSFTYNFLNYFSKSTESVIFLGAKVSDIISNKNNDIRIAPVLGYSFFRRFLIYYSYNFPLNNDNLDGKWGMHSSGIICSLYPFFKKESSTPMK